jgi:hypothetical protein
MMDMTSGPDTAQQAPDAASDGPGSTETAGAPSGMAVGPETPPTPLTAVEPTTTVQVDPFDIDHPRVIEPVEILIDGTPHRLRLPLKSIRAFQRATKVSIWDHSRVWTYPPDLDMLMHLLWAALLWEWPDLKVEQCESFDVFEFGNIHYLRRKLNQCWGENMPQPEDANGAGGGAAPNGPGQLLAVPNGG